MAGDLITNRDEILSLVSAAWKAIPANVPGVTAQSQAPLVFTMTDGDGVPKSIGRDTWARVTLQHGAGRPTAVSGRRWEHQGLLTVQCFVWRANTSDDDRAQKIAAYIVGRLKDHRGSVNFPEVYPREAPINNGFAQCDAVSRFRWEEFRPRA
jgi:hypothetical protein